MVGQYWSCLMTFFALRSTSPVFAGELAIWSTAFAMLS
jgi:hypothetical protein